MSQYTENYQLEKPDSTDDFKDFRSNYNSNMDIIDANLGGGGDTVTWNQIQSSGAKIAEISINGTQQDVYAPNGGVEIVPNPVDAPTAQLNSLGFYSDDAVTILDNGVVSTNSAYAWASYITTLTIGETYDLKLTDSFDSSHPIYSSFTWQGSTIVLTLGDRKQLTIESARAGLTYFPGAWRYHYLDIKSRSHSTVYSVGNVTDVEVNGTSVVNAQGVAEVTVPDELSDLADDSTHRTVTDTEKSTWSAKVSDNPTFTEASTRANIASGESFATILGKIKKFFTDLKTVAFSGSYNDLSDKPTIPTDYVSKANGGTFGGAVGISVPDGYGLLVLGNDKAQGAEGKSRGYMRIWSTTAYRADVYPSALTANRNFALPDKSGTLALTDDIPPAIKQGAWWTSGTSHNANDVTGEAVFAYNETSQQNVATTGTLVGFSCKDNNYPFQLQSAYTYDGLYYRRQNGDNATWGSWRQLIHSGNIGSQSVDYANTAGSAPANGGNADTVDNFHFYSERYSNVVEVNQPTANQSWGVVIKTGDWNSEQEVVQIRCAGNNVSSTAIIYLVSRSKKIWGYNTYYNTAGIQGVVVTVSNSTDLHVCLFSDVTKIKIFKSWGGGSVATESLRSDYIDTTEASFFAYKPILTDIKSLGTLTAEEFQLTHPGLDFYDPIMDKHMYLIRPGTLSAERSIYLPNKNGTIALLSDISSRRYKENIVPLSDDEAKKLLDVDIVNYDYKEGVVEEDERYDQKGAIAEDVVNLIPNAVTYADIDGEQLPDGINYTKFIPYLIKMVQIQQKEIEELKAMIKEE